MKYLFLPTDNPSVHRLSRATYANRVIIAVAIAAMVAGLIAPLFKPAPTEPRGLVVADYDDEFTRNILERIDEGRSATRFAEVIEQLRLERERVEQGQPSATIPFRLEPISAEDLGVPLDPNGRPYDSEWHLPSLTTSQTEVGTITLTDSAISVFDGVGLWLNLDESEAARIDFDGADEANVAVIWQVLQNEKRQEQARSPIGVRLDVPGRQVASWGPFNFDYEIAIEGPDSGLSSGLPLTPNTGPADGELFDDFAGRHYYLGDNDSLPGNDTLIFPNGYGSPSGMPFSIGRDSQGQTASVIFWQNWYPWRLAITDGTPPPDVTARENELIECMNGLRPIHDVTKYCFDGPIADVLSMLDAK